MKAVTITAYTEDTSQIEVIKAVIKALKIKYSISKSKEMDSAYSPEFVDMIRQGEQDLKDGKGVSMTIEDLEALCK